MLFTKLEPRKSQIIRNEKTERRSTDLDVESENSEFT